MSLTNRFRVAPCLAAIYYLFSPCHPVTLSPCQASDSAIDSPMYKNPDLPVPREEWIFPEGAKKLWLRALEQPEVDLKCRAADAIALACKRGVKGLEPAVKPLLGTLDQPDQHPSVRLAAARALIALE